MRLRRSPQSVQHGFGAIAAVVVLVLLAALAAAVVRLGSAQQLSSAQGVSVARANVAASAGLEWGAWQALKGSWTACSNASQTLDLSADAGVWVTVRCNATAYNEGESAPGAVHVVRSITITATACNSAAGCPDDSRAVGPGYVERVRQAVLVD
ncbi:MSHA biogenesis protein MshP [Ideonella sp. 4Y11]|uniref:MSHA biogenesis protein MshP n=1 Tax=Ideonella aquatica TaxID=2824119 RepID=A0A940YM07_9BURK|nr:MSHA biogenesis protein MshP [Ideonella aquatica]MBQ0958816.1 MSHA biogenesis protein MshP [Ideonella aquatica]